MRAADLFQRGVIPAEIARRLGVTHQIVSESRKAWQQGGRDALRAAGCAGQPTKLSTAQLAEVEQALAKAPEPTATPPTRGPCRDVAEVIERVTAVANHPGHVWYVLHDQLGWTWQRPARRNRNLSRARVVAVHLLLTETELNRAQVARVFGRTR